MTAKTLKPYPKYKDSGVSWIGMVPQGWKVIPLKHVCKVNAPVSHITKYYMDDTLVTFLPMDKISTDGKIDCSQKEKYVDVKTGYSSFAKDDVIIAKITPCFENGKGACLDFLDTDIGFGTTELINLRPYNKIASRFIFYITTNKIFRIMGADHMTGSAGQKRVPAEFVKNYIIPLPPRSEQDDIVAYLDDKTAKIDRLIGLYKREIELLKERRQAVIHKAVTRGLNDKVKLKDSGVSWIGMVPVGWEVIALKHVCKVNAPVSHITKYLKDDTLVTFLPMEKISIDGKIDCSQKEKYIDVKTGYSSFAKDDVIIAKITPCFENGKGACLDVLDTDIGFGTTELINLRPYNKIVSRFLFYITMNKIFRIIGADHMTGSAGQKRVPAEFVKNYMIPLPPRPEQDAIVAYLDDQCAKVDTVIGKVQSKIGLLEEYRVRLISDVVTGKVRV